MSIALLTLALVGTAALLWSIVGGYGIATAPALVRSHFLAALLSTTILVMAHSFIMFFLIKTVNNEYVMQLFDDPRGVVMVAAGLFWLSLGVAVMVKMVRFEI